MRHYEQLVERMQQDQENMIARQAEEIAHIRDKVNRYAEDQIEMMEKQKARAIRNAKAREIARCMR